MFIKKIIPRFIKDFLKSQITSVQSLSETDLELQRLSSINTQVNTTLLGNNFLSPNGYTFVQAYKEIFEKHNYYFETQNTTPFILDCGANIGLSIVYFKKYHPDAHIIAFEADKNIYSLLEQNILAFDFKNIELKQEAVWIENTYLEFVLEGGLSGKILKVDDPLNTSTAKVKAIDLSGYLNQKVDFLKLDVEGAETELIRHIAPHLHLVDRIFMEYHAYSGQAQSLSEILTVFQNNGFRYQIKEAFTIEKPYIQFKEVMKSRIFDLQLDVFAYKP